MTLFNSSPDLACTLRLDLVSCDDYVYHRGSVDIRNDHKLHNVLPRRAGVLRNCWELRLCAVLLDGWRTAAYLRQAEDFFSNMEEKKAVVYGVQ